MWCTRCNRDHYAGFCPKDIDLSRNSPIFGNLPKYSPPPLLDLTPKFKLPERNFDILSNFNKKQEVYFCGEMYCPGHNNLGGRCLQRGGPGLGLGL